MTRFLASILFLLSSLTMVAQADDNRQMASKGGLTRGDGASSDSTRADKEIPKGLKVWTINERFGDIVRATPDTLSHMYPNSIFTTGMRGEYNSTGNLGAPRINRLFVDRPRADRQFIFTQPYDYFIVAPGDFHFTNTLSPITNLTYNTAGNRINGEDHLTAKLAVNAGKKLGMGFKFDYLYGRGYYSNQASSHFNYSMYGSYLGERYQAHLLFSTNHQKNTENGGITDDKFITNPESFDDNYQASEIPTVLRQNWNRNDNQHVFFSHRYNVGFNRKVPMTAEEIKAKKFAMESKKENEARKGDEKTGKGAGKGGRTPGEGNRKETQRPTGRPDDAVIAGVEPTAAAEQGSPRIAVNGKQAADSLLAKQKKEKEDTAWVKNEYVPVTSFIHTLRYDNYTRIYQAYQTPDNYYANTYKMDEWLRGDSIYDNTTHFRVNNTFALSLLEGFNKWAKSGLKAFVSHELRHFTLPDAVGTATYNENSVYAGGQLSKKQGRTFHYEVTGEVGVAGQDAGKIDVNATADLNFKLFGDTVQLAASGFFHRYQPTFYYRHYHGRHFLWDNDDLSSTTHTRVQGLLSYAKTKTSLRVAVDELTDYTYLAQAYDINGKYQRIGTRVGVRQSSEAINVLTASLSQDVAWGPLHWETVVTFQNSSRQTALPLPKLNIYSNLFFRLKIAKVLKCELGADVCYFTKYYAPDYSPALGQFVVQENANRVEIGNYPIVNAYANFHLQQTRFFVMYSHANAGSGTKNSFLVPHYPLNGSIIRFGLSWNFFN